MQRGEIIIPYQELLGNYDTRAKDWYAWNIIPYQELLGNYDDYAEIAPGALIIPYQELLGNYDNLDEACDALELYHTKSY